MIDIKFHRRYQILYVTFEGEVGFNDLDAYFAKLNKLELPVENLAIIHDMRKVDYQLPPHRIGEVLGLFARMSAKYKYVRVASIHENAHSTAISTIIRERIDIENLEYQVFSTLEFALDWLKVKKDNQQVG
jgi:hypothetical protein